jgi:sensor histidine kinase regulating citrate/malate metabolism
MENKIKFINETREQLELTSNYWFKDLVKEYGLEKVIDTLENIIDNVNDTFSERDEEYNDMDIEDYYINMMDYYKQDSSNLIDLIELD